MKCTNPGFHTVDCALNNHVYEHKNVQNLRHSRIWDVVSDAFWTLAIVFDPVLDFFTQALSDAIGLETFRHGTNYSNYLGIRCCGANPEKGGTGAAAAAKASKKISEDRYVERSQNLFHFASDNQANMSDKDVAEWVPRKALAVFITRVASARFYILLNAMNSFRENKYVPTSVRIAQAVAQAFFIPTVKIRMTSKERDDLINLSKKNFQGIVFEQDPDSCKGDTLLGYRTNLRIGADHIGFRGLIQQGVKGNVFNRIKAYPVKAAWGCIKLINPIGIALLAGFGMYYAKTKMFNCCT